MTKKVLSVLLALLLMGAAFLPVAAEVTCTEHNHVNSAETAEITRVRKCPCGGDLRVTDSMTYTESQGAISCIHGYMDGEDKVYKTYRIDHYTCSDCGRGLDQKVLVSTRYECHGFN